MVRNIPQHNSLFKYKEGLHSNYMQSIKDNLVNNGKTVSLTCKLGGLWQEYPIMQQCWKYMKVSELLKYQF